MALDEYFLSRVYRTTVWVWAVAIIWCTGLRQPIAALGLTLGTVVGIASLMALEWTVKRSLGLTKGAAPGFPLAKYTLLKYPAYLLVLTPVVLTRNIPLIIGLVIGLGLVHLVIILKAVGQMVLQRLEKQEEV